jgi:hypothetical protein
VIERELVLDTGWKEKVDRYQDTADSSQAHRIEHRPATILQHSYRYVV